MQQNNKPRDLFLCHFGLIVRNAECKMVHIVDSFPQMTLAKHLFCYGFLFQPTNSLLYPGNWLIRSTQFHYFVILNSRLCHYPVYSLSFYDGCRLFLILTKILDYYRAVKTTEASVCTFPLKGLGGLYAHRMHI